MLAWVNPEGCLAALEREIEAQQTEVPLMEAGPTGRGGLAGCDPTGRPR